MRGSGGGKGSGFSGGGRSSFAGGRPFSGRRGSGSGSGSFCSGPELQEKLRKAATDGYKLPPIRRSSTDNDSIFGNVAPEERCRKAMLYLNKKLDEGSLAPVVCDILEKELRGCPDAPDFTEFRRNFDPAAYIERVMKRYG